MSTPLGNKEKLIKSTRPVISILHCNSKSITPILPRPTTAPARPPLVLGHQLGNHCTIGRDLSTVRGGWWLGQEKKKKKKRSEEEEEEENGRRRRGERLQLNYMGCWCGCTGSISPSLPRREWKKQGVVMWFPHKPEKKRTREKEIAGRRSRWGRFPAHYSRYSSAWIQ